MRDIHRRTIEYMRISITDRCNLNCKYCMPDHPVFVNKDELLTFEEIVEVVKTVAELGVSKIRITGGEPLVRMDCTKLIRMIKDIQGIEKVTLTTNGILLDQYLDDLIKAGINGINISLDTLDQEKFAQITGHDCFERVMKNIHLAVHSKVAVKINAVAIQGEKEWQKLIMLAKELPVHVRFIEMMPIGYGKNYKTEDNRILIGNIKQMWPNMIKDETKYGEGPAKYYKIPGFKGSIGFISAIHGKFCSTCNRIRLTSVGFLKTCLCYDDGIDLKEALREKKDKKDLKAVIEKVIANKPEQHCFEMPDQVTEQRNMITIGG